MINGIPFPGNKKANIERSLWVTSVGMEFNDYPDADGKSGIPNFDDCFDWHITS